MKYGIIIVSLFLGCAGFLIDGYILPMSDSFLFTFIFFLLPTVYCVGDIWDEFLNKDDNEVNFKKK